MKCGSNMVSVDVLTKAFLNMIKELLGKNDQNPA
jgi:hypothetical protein